MKTKSLTLYSKITFAFGLLFVILGVSIGVTLWQTQRTGVVISNLVDAKMPITRTALLLENSVSSSMAAIRGFMLSGEDRFKEDFANSWRNGINQNFETLKILVTAQNDPQLTQVISNLSAKLIELRNYQDSIIESLKKDNKNETLTIFHQQVPKIVIPLSEDLSMLVDMQTKAGTQAATDVKNALFQLTVIEWALLVLGLVMGIIISRSLSKSISVSVVELANSADAISNGENIKKINITGSTEIEHLGTSFNKMQEIMTEITTAANSISKGDYTLKIKPRCSDDKLIYALSEMTHTLEKNRQYFEEQTWLQKGISKIVEAVANNAELNKLCNEVLAEISQYLEAGSGAIYLINEKNKKLKLFSSYAYTEREFLANEFKIGNGIVGQVALEKKAILLKNITRKNMVITTALTEEAPINVYTVPLIDKQEIIGVIELAFHKTITELLTNYIERITPLISSSINVSKQKMVTEKLLAEQQKLTEELQVQQEELKASNEELESQTEELKTTEEELRLRDEQQRTLNQNLEERNKRLEQQTAELTKAQNELMKKTEELQTSSKYKSEFLANMSHELRTPLNSLLILSSMLTENEDKNLHEDQIESLKVIHRSGCELLELINDILDIAKVEAGKLGIQHSDLKISDFLEKIEADFQPVARNKGISFSIEVEKDLVETIYCDEQRLKQIIKNLLSNAFKFTEKGSVKLYVHKPSVDVKFANQENNKNNSIAWSVIDTGIGISKDKQEKIFQTFYQVDGTTSRKHGGAGLGLSISSQLAGLLNGEILVESTEGTGSTFTLVIPIINKDVENLSARNEKVDTTSEKKILAKIENNDSSVKKSISKTLLIIEDDVQFATVLKDACQKKGYSCWLAANGKSGLDLAFEKNPTGILLDVNLPDISGLEVADALKKNNLTKDIPIHFISGDDKADEAMQHGAASYLMKPITIEKLGSAIQDVSKAIRADISHLLIVEDDVTLGQQIKKIFEDKAVAVSYASSGKEALDLLKSTNFDCMVLDLGLPDISGFDLLKTIQEDTTFNHPAIVIYTGRELTEDEHQLLQKYSDNIIVKSRASMQRLLDEAALFLHRVEKNLKVDSTSTQLLLNSEIKFQGQKVLLVDDDMRNTFALANVLKKSGLNISIAPNGKAAIDMLHKEANFDGVLMDIMMPVMDGFEAIEKIRMNDKFSTLPIIALTAKAMPADREKCLQVGANDYLPKPVDVNKLLILLRAQICQ